MNKIWSFIFPYLKNKYVITLLLFVIWIAFFTANNLIERYGLLKKYDELEKQKCYYLEKINEDNKRMKELKTDDDNLEKYARETYYMKKENEDIFIIVEEE